MQYWLLVELPKQEKQEPVPAYVLRACATLEKTQKPGDGVKTTAKLADEDDKRRERIERLECKHKITTLNLFTQFCVQTAIDVFFLLTCSVDIFPN